LKKYLSIALNVGISVAAIGYLGYRAAQEERFWALVEGEKNWGQLLLAGLTVLMAVLLTMFRWQLLVRALDIPLKLSDALRVGFLGYLFNLLPLGLVGGDGLKAFFIAKKFPSHATEAVATVLLDRVIGLTALLMFAAMGTLQLDLAMFEEKDRALLSTMCIATRWAGGISFCGILVFLIPGMTSLSIWDQLAKFPVVGARVGKLVEAMRLYRKRADRILLAVLMSLGVHGLYVIMIYLVGSSLLEDGKPTAQPSFMTHFVMGPLSMTAGALPLGTMEVVLTLLYDAMIPADQIANAIPQKGFLIALVYRLLQICVASIGMMYYLLGKTETQALDETKPDEAK